MEFRLLGPVEVADGGGPIQLGGPKQRLVLAHLLLRANQVVPAEVLIDAVWPQDPPQTARNTLQTYVSHIRKLIGNDRVAARAPGYVLRAEPGEVDAVVFETALRDARRLVGDPERSAETLRGALALWRGAALADLALEPSIQGETARLEELRLQAVEERIAAEMELGRHEELVPDLEMLVAEHPLRERLRAHLMLALYRAGRQAEALSAFHRAREILADELGIDPSPDLRLLHERVLRQDETLQVRGRPLRGYRLLERIGEGSFGVVHRALQPGVERDVAIKTIHPQLANDPAFIRRFEREAQLVARLEHPHVVPLYDYWRDPDGAYLVMRYVSGGSIRGRIEREGPLPSSAILGVLEQVSQALAAAHRQGVVHRDVKPDNILLDHEGNAYLSDFGIATDLRRSTLTAAASPGTPAYLSPEQIRGDEVTPASDQYSLGIVLFEALTGEPPFSADTLQALVEHHLHEPLPSPSSLRPDLPAAVDDVVARATAKDPDARFADAVDVAAALRAAFGKVDVARRPPAVAAAANPYKGLHPFLEADAADFFGRDALVEDLLRRMAESAPGSRFLGVVGPSGSGKSSLIRAGLVPALRAGAVGGSAGWFIGEMYPGAHPLEELEGALLRVAVNPPPSLIEQLERDELGLLRAVKRILPDDGSELLLVIDQFEELFTLTRDEGDRLRFLESVRAAVSDPRSRLRVVVTLRADLYDRPLLYPGFGELLAARHESITPMRADELERAIAGPAERAGVACEPGVLAEMVADVVDRPGALPLLQYALTELFERTTDGEMRLETYRQIGGVPGALARRAEELYAGFDVARQAACRQLLLRLVSLGEGREDTRRRVRISDLESLEVDPGAMASVQEALTRHRLVAYDRDPVSREPTVEVAHEALLRAWSRLHRWIDEARDDVRQHERLASAAREWEAGGRDASFLLRGARLERTETWANATELALTRSERAFLSSSGELRDRETQAERERAERERAVERRSLRRARALVAMLAVAALVAGTLTVIATDQRDRAQREARIAAARGLAAASLANVGVDPDLAIHLALEAVTATRDADGTVLPEAAEALHRAVGASRNVFSAPALFGVDFMPDGTRLAATGEDRVARIWDLGTREAVGTFEGHTDQLVSLAVSPDGSRLATTSLDGVVHVWDTETHGIEATFETRDQALSPMWHPDGDLLAVSDHEGIIVWNVEDRIEVLRLSGGPGHAFSPDGTQIVAPSSAGATIWDVPSGRVAATIPFPGSGVDANWSPDGRRVAVVGGGGGAGVYDAITGDERVELAGMTGEVGTVEFSPGGSRIATGSGDGIVRVWDASDGRRVLELAGLGGSVQLVSWSPDETSVAAGGGGGRAIVWDVTPSGAGELPTLTGHDGPVVAVAFSPDDDLLATGGEDGTVRIWDPGVGVELRQMHRFASPVFAIDFSPTDGDLAAADAEGNLRLWAPDMGAERPIEFPTLGGVTALSFTPGGESIVATDAGGGVAVLDADRGEAGMRICCHRPFAFNVAVSADGAMIATVGDDHAGRVWNASTGNPISVLEGHTDTVFAVAFDPRGGRVATASIDGSGRIWDPDTGDQLLRLEGHAGGIFDIAYAPDGSLIATTGIDGTTKLWDPDLGEAILTLTGHEGPVIRVAFSEDGTRLATTGDDGTVRLYVLDVDELIDLAGQRVTRSLTDEECRRYLHVDTCPPTA